MAASTSEEASFRPRSSSDRYGMDTLASAATSARVRPWSSLVRRSTSPSIVRSNGRDR
jgi:hypothetical protein